MTRQTPWERVAAYDREQLMRDCMPTVVPPKSMIRAWETKMSVGEFELNGWTRRAYRTTYGERLAMQLTVLLGVVAGCAIVWAAVWGVMA